MLIKMKVAGLTIDSSNDVPIVVLKEIGGERALPIYIGYFEASAIAMVLEESIKPARPMTHDLLKSILSELDATVVRIEINDLRNNTFFASLFIEQDGEVREIDSRPSDAIALALRADATILVADHIIDEIYAESRPLEDDTENDACVSSSCAESSDSSDSELREYLENLSPEDFGKYKM